MAVASWLTDFKGLSSQEIQDFSKKIVGDGHLKSELFKLLKGEKNPEKLDPVIHQLFSFYRLDNDLLQRFALEFLPSILYNYFHSIYSTDHKSGASIEALLLGIYNIDAAKSQEEYLIDKTPPSSFLNIASVYHSPVHSDFPTRLTKITLEKFQEKAVHHCHNLEHVDSITNRNRLQIISHSLMRYNHDIAFYSSVSHLDVCHLCTLFIKPTMHRINTSTVSSSPSFFPFSLPRFSKLKSDVRANPPSSSLLPSLPVSEDLISQLLHAVFFIMYNDLPDEGYLALESLYFRAIYDLLPHSILATSAVYNLLHSQGKTEGKMNLSPLELTITVPPPTNKDAITGASFKPHILPEDIEVKDVGKETSNPSGHSPFGTAIGEEPSTAVKMRQKSVISKVFHIPMAKRKDDAERKEEEKFIVSASLSPPSQSGIQFSIAKKALKNPFKSEQQTSTTSSSAASMARLEFLTKRDTISITPYFSQLDSSETSPNLPVSKADKKHKSKGSKLRRKHLKRAPSSGSSTSPKHSLSVSSYLSKDVIQERNEVTKSDVDDEDEEEDDEQVECQDETDEIINESDTLVDTKTRQTSIGNSTASFQNKIGRSQLLLRHITFANNADAKECTQVEPGARQTLNRYDSDKVKSTKEADDIDEEVTSSDMPLLERRDSIPRLAALITNKGDASEDGDDDDGDDENHGLEQNAVESKRLIRE